MVYSRGSGHLGLIRKFLLDLSTTCLQYGISITPGSQDVVCRLFPPRGFFAAARAVIRLSLCGPLCSKLGVVGNKMLKLGVCCVVYSLLLLSFLPLLSLALAYGPMASFLSRLVTTACSVMRPYLETLNLNLNPKTFSYSNGVQV